MTKLTHEQIDNYHAGKMSESEMINFEKMLDSDPSLKAESDFQSDIVNGLKEYRKQELKSRMDAIHVGPTWIEFAQQSTLVKSLGGVVIASLIGTGIYVYGERPELINSDEPATVEAAKIESIEFVWDLGEEEVVASKDLEKPIKEEDAVVSMKGKTEETQGGLVEKIVDPSVEASEKTQEAFIPTFKAPVAESVDEEEGLSTSELDVIPESEKSSSREEPIDVRSEITKSSVIKYKYYDGKLFLKGDFDKAPYDILEINSAKKRRIFVYYLNNYYKVGNTDKLIELPRVTNSEIISELEVLRANK